MFITSRDLILNEKKDFSISVGPMQLKSGKEPSYASLGRAG